MSGLRPQAARYVALAGRILVPMVTVAALWIWLRPMGKDEAIVLAKRAVLAQYPAFRADRYEVSYTPPADAFGVGDAYVSFFRWHGDIRTPVFGVSFAKNSRHQFEVINLLRSYIQKDVDPDIYFDERPAKSADAPFSSR